MLFYRASVLAVGTSLDAMSTGITDSALQDGPAA